MEELDHIKRLNIESDDNPIILTQKMLGYLGRIATGSKNVLSRATTISDDICRPINKQHGIFRLLTMEGYTRPKQARFFQELLAANRNILNIAEIGFNGGHSSYIFLNARNNVRVVSFDIAAHSYVDCSKAFIDQEFPRRHNLVVGDSKITIQEYAHANDENFDLVFIDGGHDHKTVEADLSNCKTIAHKDTIVIMDDYMPGVHYGEGPVKAWDEAIMEGFVMQDSMHTGDNHKWVVGRYIFD